LATPTAAGRKRAAATAEDRERPREILTYWAYRAGERLIGLLPRGLVLSLASAAGNAAYDLAGSKRGVVEHNLARPLGVAPDDRRARRTARRAFSAYAKYLVDVMYMGSLSAEEMGRLVAIDNIEILDEARAGGTGVLICTVHVGGMDIIAPGLLRHAESLNVVADDTSYGRLYDHLKAVRARHGLTLVGWRNLRGIIRALRDRQNIVLFCDGGFRRGDVPVEFLGEPTTFPAGPATLSARSGAPMLPVYCRRTAGDRFRARGLPLIRSASEEPAEIHRATQLLADELGSVIRESPGQWYMFRPVWPETDADRDWARSALEAARRGEDWSRRPAA
jgi:lauroyl/myristoyl acyltransferase